MFLPIWVMKLHWLKLAGGLELKGLVGKGGLRVVWQMSFDQDPDRPESFGQMFVDVGLRKTEHLMCDVNHDRLVEANFKDIAEELEVDQFGKQTSFV